MGSRSRELEIWPKLLHRHEIVLRFSGMDRANQIVWGHRPVSGARRGTKVSVDRPVDKTPVKTAELFGGLLDGNSDAYN